MTELRFLDVIRKIAPNNILFIFQVYTLHTVDYSNPSAIEGAIRDASNAEAKAKKQEESQKTKHEVSRLLQITNYYGKDLIFLRYKVFFM